MLDIASTEVEAGTKSASSKHDVRIKVCVLIFLILNESIRVKKQASVSSRKWSRLFCIDSGRYYGTSLHSRAEWESSVSQVSCIGVVGDLSANWLPSELQFKETRGVFHDEIWRDIERRWHYIFYRKEVILS